MPISFNRDTLLQCALETERRWDMIVVGGGATGVGAAVDAASRGYRVLLLEQSDFGKGTSSRSTKLIHGGMRYLQQGNVSLVREALRERGLLLALAPHLVHDSPFVVPAYRLGVRTYYGLGMKLYDWLSGKYGLGHSRRLSPQATVQHLPTIRTEGLRGGVVYYDAVFDDARLLVNLVQTAVENGAVCLNYVRVREILKEGSRISGVLAEDVETGDELRLTARVVINATGPFADDLRRMDEPQAEPIIAPSQGVHVVLAKSFLPGEAALIVPRTRDGRVMFAIPWRNRVLVGTTDTPIEHIPIEPRPLDEEIDFLLETAGQYLQRMPRRSDVLSTFVGVRPLARTGRVRSTATLSRDHVIVVSESGLVTITGGKWTTYRRMAQDCVDRAAKLAALDPRPCRTEQLRVHGFAEGDGLGDEFECYGSDAEAVASLLDSDPAMRELLHPDLPYRSGQVIWAARQEFARTVDDVLARRIRGLFLDARAAIESASKVASLLGGELGRDEAWQDEQMWTFRAIAEGYVLR